jgi:hypothetical protein
MYGMCEEIKFCPKYALVCRKRRIKEVRAQVVDSELSLLDKLAPKIHQEVFVYISEARYKMGLPITNSSFSSISSMGVRGDILHFDLGFITEKMFQLCAVFVVEHLELWAVA